MKKWLFPIASAIVFALQIICTYIVGFGGFALDRNVDVLSLIGVILAGPFILISLVVVPPSVGFIYAKCFLKDQKNRFLFTLYQSLMITLPYLILSYEDRKTLLYATYLFAWCELLSLLGLVQLKWKFQKKK